MSKARISSLDALRGIAALAVVLYHYTFRYDAIYGHEFSLEHLFIFKYGYLGVQLFFMISGFVIYLSLENTSNIKKFAFNRFARLYPAYWFAVIFTFIVVLALGLPGRDVSFLHMLVNLSMLNGFVGIPSVDGVYWTLRVELSFYFVIATLYFLLPRKQVLIGFLSLLILAFFVKYLYLLGNVHISIKILNLILSLDFLHFFGAGIGFYLLSKKNDYLLASLLIATSILYNLAFGKGAELIITLSFYPLFLLLSAGKAKFLSTRLLTYLGAISYSLYLVHQNIGYMIFNYSYKYNIHPVIAFFIALSVSILIAHFSTRYIEQTIGRKLKKLSDYA